MLLNVAHQWSQRFRQTPTGRFSTDHKLHFRNFYCLLLLWEGCQNSRIFRSWFPEKKYSWTHSRTQNYHCPTQSAHKRQVLSTKQWDCGDQLLLETDQTTRRLRLLLFSLSHHSSCLAFWSPTPPPPQTPPPPPIINAYGQLM